jgi:ABC-type transporter Mla subunit MlaD
VTPPVGPPEESEALWRVLRAVERRIETVEQGRDLTDLRAQLRDLSREVSALGDDLRDLLATDRAGVVELLAARRSLRAPKSEPPSRAALRAAWRWLGWGVAVLALAVGAAAARACGVPIDPPKVAPPVAPE